MDNKKNRFTEQAMADISEAFSTMLPIMTDCDKNEDFKLGLELLERKVPILPLRNMVLFPGVVMSVMIGRDKSRALIDKALKDKILIGVVCQKQADTDNPGAEDLYKYGTIAQVIRKFDLPDGTTTVLLQGKARFILEDLVTDEPYLIGMQALDGENMPSARKDSEFSVALARIKELSLQLFTEQGKASPELVRSIKNIKNVIYQVNFPCCNFDFTPSEKQALLGCGDYQERAMRLLKDLKVLLQIEQLKTSVEMKTQADLDQQQREYFLRQQIKNMQAELGDKPDVDIIAELYDKASDKSWPESIQQSFEKEMRKLERLNPQSPDYSVQLQYINTILSLPWKYYTPDNYDLGRAKRILDYDHYGLEKVKERIIEHLAVLKLKGNMKAPILCLYGPPGVGKTSLGRSIADALSRQYVRISLGGMHDEAEIRGHRRTYLGAMCGRILHGLQKAGSSNPVFVLDEIDKVSADFRGDPASALLEVLDPEQNNTFHDNYLDLDYDLSQILFIATANNISSISQPLLDRMELIEVSGYVTEEKIEIAQRYLIPKGLADHGLPLGCVRFPKKTIQTIIESYTRESGVRELDKRLATIMRKLAKRLALKQPLPLTMKVSDLESSDYLGAPRYTRDKYQGNDYAGVVTGLAWTAVGGEILFIESSLSKGKGEKLTLTGNLGDVMKESAIIALQYIRAHADLFGIDEQLFEQWNVHIHVPEGAIPKDGPSAGITMATSLVSAFTQRKVRQQLAMTGEITLRGKVLPVGGIREKILAAKRAGITEIILCRENERDILEIKPDYLKGLNFHYVDEIHQVIDLALLDEKVEHPQF